MKDLYTAPSATVFSAAPEQELANRISFDTLLAPPPGDTSVATTSDKDIPFRDYEA